MTKLKYSGSLAANPFKPYCTIYVSPCDNTSLAANCPILSGVNLLGLDAYALPEYFERKEIYCRVNAKIYKTKLKDAELIDVSEKETPFKEPDLTGIEEVKEE